MTTGREVRIAAENLLLSYLMVRFTSEGTQAHELAEARFGRLCELGAEVGFAASAPELGLVVADVVETMPPPRGNRPHSRTGMTWMMQARFILARRLNTAIAARQAAA